MDEVHYLLKEEVYEADSEILATNEPCTAMYFVVQGRINLYIHSSLGEKHLLQCLKQGDVLGQYSVLFNQKFLFSVEA